MKSKFLLSIAVMLSPTLFAQKTTEIVLFPDSAKQTISRHIYGQFSEHLGSCIYNGLWVGENSSIPNIKGYRKDVFEALKALDIPNLRWPGGCFADEYHWKDGVGPKDQRPRMVNTSWGGVVEDNSFGTHEFLNLCEMLECEPYVSANVGSGSVEEMSEWVAYMTADAGPMSELRKKNGREKPWRVKYLGVGNESWGCGGSMTPEYYSDLYRRYATFSKNYNNNQLYKIASGASDYDYNWTDVLMKNVGHRMQGLSLHYYTVADWTHKGSATKFNEKVYWETMAKALEVEDVLQKHIAIMDKYDPQKKIGLLLDEWGTWFDVEPGTNPGFLYQQNTMRDAMVAAASLNIFHKYTDRLSMANIAQIVNVLQAMILTDEDKMVLTPTYHVFEMYRPHQDAQYIPAVLIDGDKFKLRGRDNDVVNYSASKDKNGKIHISLANLDLKNDRKVEIRLQGNTVKNVSGRILKAKSIDTHNTFENPNQVTPAVFKGAKVKDGLLTVNLPAESIVVLEL